MNPLFEWKLPISACGLALALGGSAALAAEVHKCRNSEGATIYQQAPCEKTGTTGRKLDVSDPVGSGKSGDKSGSPGSNKSMHEAYQRRMEARDYEGALPFATTDKEKADARRMITNKNEKCANLSLKVQKTQADLQAKGERWKSAADAAQAEHALYCR